MSEKKECIAPEYSLCPRCKNDNTELCLDCTTIYGMSPISLCGVPVSTQMVYYHHNFEVKPYTLVHKRTRG